MGFGMKCAVRIKFQQKGLILIFLTSSLFKLRSSLHFIRSLYHYVVVDFGRTKLKERGLNEEFYCESLTKSLFMVCGRGFNKMVIEWVI